MRGPVLSYDREGRPEEHRLDLGATAPTSFATPFGADDPTIINRKESSIMAQSYIIYIGPHALAMGAAIIKTNAALIADAAGLPAPPPPPSDVFRDGFE